MRLLRPDFPFRPDRLPFFYGWVIAVVSTVGVLMSIPGQTMGVSVFTDPLMEATGLSRVALANTYLAGTVASGMLLPYGGVLLDRFGARLTIVLSSALLALTLCYLAAIDVVAKAVAGALGTAESAWVTVAALILGFFALRFSGQGMLTLVSRALIGRWFDRLRGIVSGVTGPFVSFGFAGAPLLLAAWIDAAGWRGAWLEMALTVGIAMSLLGWLVYRDTPEECGLPMDGRAAPDPDEKHEGPLREPTYTRSQSLGTPAFWAVTLTMALQGLSVTGVTFHIVDLGAEQGMSRTAAIGIFPFIAGVSVATALAIGWLTNHVSIQRLLVFMLATQAVGVASAAHMGELGWRAATIVGLGASGGCFGPLSTVALPRFFGRLHLGSIASAMMMWIVWGSALGPSAFALSRDLLGSYATALYGCAALCLPTLALSWLAPTPPLEPEG